MAHELHQVLTQVAEGNLYELLPNIPGRFTEGIPRLKTLVSDHMQAKALEAKFPAHREEVQEPRVHAETAHEAFTFGLPPKLSDSEMWARRW